MVRNIFKGEEGVFSREEMEGSFSKEVFKFEGHNFRVVKPKDKKEVFKFEGHNFWSRQSKRQKR
jgi:hypothetical protein